MPSLISTNFDVDLDIPKIVRFDTPDTQFVAPLREFFTNFGCTVYFSAGNGPGLLYHLVVGDYEYVKNFLPLLLPVSRRLAIIWGVYQGEEPDLSASPWKVVYIDPRPLTPADVNDLLQFLFTSSDHVLDLRHFASPRPTALPQTIAPPLTSPYARPTINHELSTSDQASSDARRVSDTIARIFQKDAESHLDHFLRRLSALVFVVKIWLFCLLLFITPILWYSGAVGVGAASLYFRARALTSGQSNPAFLTQLNYQSLSQAGYTLSLISLPFVWLDYPQPVRTQERILQTLANSSSALSTASEFNQVAEEFSHLVLPRPGSPTRAFPATTAQRLQIILSQLTTQLDLASADLNELISSGSFVFKPLQHQAQKLVDRISSTRDSLTNLNRLLTLYPGVAGFKNDQTFLVLLQNNLELRPGGGFIGSVGLAKFLDGQLVDFRLQDVYEIDGQLKGHVDPPVPVAELLKQEHWYLRDSNWDPDFRLNARQAAWFYEKETGVSVDGVIAINGNFLVDLIAATGPLSLPDYSERITSENFFGKSFFYTQADFFPGSTQKRDFLGSVWVSLLSRITSGRGVSPLKLFSAFEQATSRHDIQWFMTDPLWQTLLERYGWAGVYPKSLNCPPLASDNCISVFSGWIEANVSVNKANYFLNRSSNWEINLSELGEIHSVHSLTYQNSSPPDGGSGGGPYRAYLRHYSTPASIESKYFLSSTLLPLKSASQSVPYVDPIVAPTPLSGMSLVFDLPPGQQLLLAAATSAERRLIFADGKAYFFVNLAKQSGVTNTEEYLTLNFPRSWSVRELSPASEIQLANAGVVRYNMATDQDYSILLEFQKLR